MWGENSVDGSGRSLAEELVVALALNSARAWGPRTAVVKGVGMAGPSVVSEIEGNGSNLAGMLIEKVLIFD